MDLGGLSLTQPWRKSLEFGPVYGPDMGREDILEGSRGLAQAIAVVVTQSTAPE